MNSVKILHAVRSAITAIAELLVCLPGYKILKSDFKNRISVHRFIAGWRRNYSLTHCIMFISFAVDSFLFFWCFCSLTYMSLGCHFQLTLCDQSYIIAAGSDILHHSNWNFCWSEALFTEK